jgi:hypothetical protein
MEITTLALLVLAPVLVWRIYSRIKAQMTRQRSILQRHYTGLGVFAAMAIVPMSQLMDDLSLLPWLVGGVAAGLGYGWWGLKKTRYEVTQEGYFFTPHRLLGLVVAMQFVAFLMYIGFEIYANQGSGQATPKVTDYPLALSSMGLVAGYFGIYSAGLLKWRRTLRKAVDAA